MPVAAAAGLVGGLIRQAVPNTEEIWKLGPFTFLSIPRWLVRLFRGARMSWECCRWGPVSRWRWAVRRWVTLLNRSGSFIWTREELGSGAGAALDRDGYCRSYEDLEQHRIEMNLEQHQQLLLKARMDALSAQINPHFLFNTLNTVSSLIRYDPDTARGVVIKLSNILRPPAAQA